MIEYKKAVSGADLLVDARTDQVMIGHRESLTDGILCIRRAEFDALSEEEIVEKFNAHIDRLLDGILNERPIEIVHGKAQIKWSQTCRQWTPVGDVLRCELGWDREEEGVSVIIDDKKLSGYEFLKLLEVNEGWGMRIEFMHPNRLLNPPEPLLKKSGRK